MENGLPPIARLRAQIEGEEFDYLALLRSLQDYAYPRDKITTMLRWGDIVRVKKGIYVFGDAHARRPYSREILANMIYGPSYVSLDSALQYNARITNVTSMERYLLDDLRIYPAGLAALDAACLEAIAAAYGSRKVRLLAAATRSLKRDHAEKQGAP